MKKLLRYPTRRIITLLGLIFVLGSLVVFFSLPGCGSSGERAQTADSSVAREEIDAGTSSEKETTTPKHLGIKPWWTYDVNTIGGGGKAMTHLWGGNFLVQYTDISFPGRGLPVELRRTYNSQNTAKGSFGKGWTCLFDTHLVINESNVVLVDAYGTRYNFTNPQPDGDDILYKAPAGRNTIFKKLADGTYTEKKKNGSTYCFDQAGTLLRIQHRNVNNGIQLIYNEVGDPSAIQEASGRTTHIVCDDNHRISTITDPEGRITSYYYQSGHLHKVVDPALHRTLFDYNDQGLLFSITNPRSSINNPGNFASTIAYDDQGRISTFQDPLYTVTYQYYDDRTEVTDTNDHHLVYYLNAKGNNIQTIDSLQNTTWFTWDNKMNITSVKNAKDQVTNYTYDSKGNVLSTANDLFTISYTYDSSNNLTSTTDGRQKTTAFTYVPKPNDPDGVLDHVTTPLGRTVSFIYNDYDEPTTVINAREKSTRYTFSIDGNITDVFDAHDKNTHITYNSVGEALTVTDPLQRTTTFAYYPNGLVETVTAPPGPDGTGAKTEYKYDPNGNRTKIIDALGRHTTYTFDEDDRIKTVTDAKSKVSTYTYEKGRLISTQDPLGFTTTMMYDANDRMTSRSNPITAENHTYDPLGNVLIKSTQLGDITYGYDAINRLVQVSMPDRAVTYTLDNNGNRTGSSIFDTTGAWTLSHMSFSYNYDDDNRLTNKTKTLEGNVIEELAKGYDNNNNLTSLSITAHRCAPLTPALDLPEDISFSFAYGYDDLDRQISVTNSIPDSNDHTITATYDDAGNMTGVAYPGGSTSVRAYDQENRIVSVTNDYPLGYLPHLVYSYLYDKMGNCTSLDTNPRKEGIPGPRAYSYDRLNRLMYDQNAMMRYVYDDGGNKITDVLLSSLANVTVNYTLNSAHQVVRIQPSDLNRTTSYLYDYDVNGNMSKKSALTPVEGYGMKTLFYTAQSYNPMNRLTDRKYILVEQYPPYVEYLSTDTRQSYDDDDELLFCEERYYIDNYYWTNEPDIYATFNTVNGYDKGVLLYKNIARNARYDHGVFDGTYMTYELEFYTYLNGMKVEKTTIRTSLDASDSASALISRGHSMTEQLMRKRAVAIKKGTVTMPAPRPISKIDKSGVIPGPIFKNHWFFIYDGQNNVTDVASAGVPDFFYIGYTSYGEAAYGEGPHDFAYEYGGYKGYETGLMGYKTGVRDYDPQTGRFLQPDPFKGYLSDPASQNPYMYCRGNPIKYADPSGYVDIGISREHLEQIKRSGDTSLDIALILGGMLLAGPTRGVTSPVAAYGATDLILQGALTRALITVLRPHMTPQDQASYKKGRGGKQKITHKEFEEKSNDEVQEMYDNLSNNKKRTKEDNVFKNKLEQELKARELKNINKREENF